jgi:cation diffusion facilitator CzcD-associated flavoprotein CzcO
MTAGASPRCEVVPDFEVLIVGAGFAGLGMAIKLQAAGESRFAVLEAAPAIGGTWRDNTYPGCACDIPSHLYSFSFAQSAAWTRTYPTQPEIAGYLHRCVADAGLAPFIRLSTALEEAAYDESAGLWRVRVSGGESMTTRVLVSAMGGLSRPAVPALPGADLFRGPAFHSARWDHGADLAGKRIAVVGTGASAIQFVPEIAPAASHLTVFQRTPPWVLPKLDRQITPGERRWMERVPGLLQAARARIYWTLEARAMAFLHPKYMHKAQAMAAAYLERKITDPRLRAKLLPDYTIGCKRVLISNDYYPTLTRPNVSVVTEPIACLTPTGVETADGAHHPADVLIYATGFRAGDMLSPARIIGRGGVDLNERWREGAEAYLGLTVAGFPNLFLLVGPNTGLGHNSMVFMIESQVRYVMSALRLLRRTQAPLDVRPAVEAAFNADLQTRMGRTVWATGCRSWYMNARGRNTTLWPDFSWKYRLRTRQARRADYQVAAD